MAAQDAPQEDSVEPESRMGLLQAMRSTDDWWAIWLGGLVLGAAFLSVWWNAPEAADGAKTGSSLAGWIAKPGSWTDNPVDAFSKTDKKTLESRSLLVPILTTGLILMLLFGAAGQVMGRSLGKFIPGFLATFGLATVAYVMAGQTVVKNYNLEYALWALLVGLLISNTVRTPGWLKPAIQTEFFIKTGLVLLGAEVLLSRLLTLGIPGICVAWIVTPIVLISTYAFGQRILKMPSRSLNMVIAADMSVCGVSAAIATAAACRARKEELSFAVGLSLTFTVVMMIVQPALIRAVDMDTIVGGAWIGGTIDATGAVVAAGVTLGDDAEKVAATVKMIQNILIGIVSFCVAVYWVTRVDRRPDGPRPGVGEIWYRFPKFVLGFVAASIVFSIAYSYLPGGEQIVSGMIADVTKGLRGWLFCLAFVCIGLETDFRSLMPFLRTGKPLILYVAGQSLNLVLTLAMAYLMFGVVFRDSIAEMFAK